MNKKTPTIEVRNAQWAEFPVVSGGERGSLQFAESERTIPFPIMRTMVISGAAHGAVRGAHAHKKFDQVLVAVRGSLTLGLDDGTKKQDIVLNDPRWGVRMGPKLWHTMRDFSSDAVLLVFVSHYHDETDYIRDYNEFLRFIKTDKPA